MSYPRLLSLTLVSALGCGGESTPPPDAITDNFDRAALLAHLGQHVLLPIHDGFAEPAAALPAAVDAYCDALDAGAVGTTRDAAVTAWTSTMDAWEQAEALLVGPAAMDDKTLRYEIYSWPSLGPCELDRDTLAHWNDPASYSVAVQPVNQRSLLAIEYLLFNPSTAHACPLEPAGWSALAADLPRARCRLAEALAGDVAAKATALRTAWAPTGGDYLGALTRAGQAGSSIASAHAAVNLISDAMFYVDRMVKDMKLAEAAGIAENACLTVQEPCLREVELALADRATFAIRTNLRVLREAFTGTTATADGPGFDDFLIAVGHPEVATRMTQNLDAAIAAAAALPDSFLGALANDYDAVVATHAAVNLFTDDLKTQFLTVLSLDIPDEVASDND